VTGTPRKSTPSVPGRFPAHRDPARGGWLPAPFLDLHGRERPEHILGRYRLRRRLSGVGGDGGGWLRWARQARCGAGGRQDLPRVVRDRPGGCRRGCGASVSGVFGGAGGAAAAAGTGAAATASAGECSAARSGALCCPAATGSRPSRAWPSVARRAGSGHSIWAMAAASPAEQPGTGGSSIRIARSVAPVLSRSNGPLPSVAAYNVAPSDHTSAADVIGADSNSSGASWRSSGSRGHRLQPVDNFPMRVPLHASGVNWPKRSRCPRIQTRASPLTSKRVSIVHNDSRAGLLISRALPVTCVLDHRRSRR
jgi:hypothetical protein